MIPVRLGGIITVIVTIPILMSMTIISLADAAPYNTFISITRSETCQKTDCADLRDYIKYDNSTKSISGKLYQNSQTGDYYRKGALQNSHTYYNIFSGKVFVFVEPDQATLVRSHQIILTPSLEEYIPNIQATKKETSFHKTVRTTYTGVYVDPKCDNALVGVKQNIDIKKVIAHLASDCKTDLGNKKTILEAKTKHDIGTTSKYKLDSYYDYVKKNCLHARNACDLQNKAVTTNNDKR